MSKTDGKWIKIDTTNLAVDGSGNLYVNLDTAATPTAGRVWDAVAISNYVKDSTIDSIGITVDNDVDVITTGVLSAKVVVPYDCEIIRVVLVSDETGSIEFGISRLPYANDPPATNIVGTNKPAIVTDFRNNITDLTGWTVSLDADDILYFSVVSCTTITYAQLFLMIKAV